MRLTKEQYRAKIRAKVEFQRDKMFQLHQSFAARWAQKLVRLKTDHNQESGD